MPIALGIVTIIISLMVGVYLPKLLRHDAKSGWRTVDDEVAGWSMRYPVQWQLQHFDYSAIKLTLKGIAISNMRAEIPRSSDGASWDFRSLAPNFVMIEFSHVFGGGPRNKSVAPSRFPLSLEDAQLAPSSDSLGGPTPLYLPVVAPGDPGFRLEVWFGTHASLADKATAAKIVSSISF